MTTTPRPLKRLSAKQLQNLPVLTVCGVKSYSLLKDYVTVGQAADAGVITRDRLDTVNFVFLDERTRRSAYAALSDGLAKEMLSEFAGYDLLYVARRPIARIAFSRSAPLEQPVFDERQRIYLKEEFRPASFYTEPSFSTYYDNKLRSPELVKPIPQCSEEEDDKALVAGPSTHPPLGHSLGSALASLCYARFLRSPQDLGTDLILKDCYSFGTPRLGDGDFVSAFEESIVTPRDRPNILWRVQNHLDVVTMVPPGLADNESGRATLSSVSVLNYGHISASMVLRPFQLGLPFPLSFFSRSKRAESYRVDESGSFHEAVSVQIADETYQGGLKTAIPTTSLSSRGCHPILRRPCEIEESFKVTQPIEYSTNKT